MTIDTQLYLNHWIAVVRQRVIGVGQTRAQAERAAKQIRPKEKPALFFVDGLGRMHSSPPPNPAAWIHNHVLLQQVVEILQNHGSKAYLVGGAVRDLLLGREQIVDLDFAVPGDGLRVARSVANALDAAFYPLDEARKTGRVVCEAPNESGAERFYLDFATFRGGDLAEDLADRDFTINAIALSLDPTPRLIDPLGGQQDLENRLIRAASSTAFRSDPVRVIRAVRQAVDFDFVLADSAKPLLSEAAALLPLISAERQRDELMKLLNTPHPGDAVTQLQALGALLYLAPEAAAMAGVPQSPPHHLDVFRHTALALNRWAEMDGAGWPALPDALRQRVQSYLGESLAGGYTLRQLMPLALLLHDTGKPLTRERIVEDGQTRYTFIKHEHRSAGVARKYCKRLRFSNQAQDFVVAVVRHHMRPLMLSQERKISRRAIFRFFRDTGGAKFQAGPAVALHALADHRATYAPGTGQAEEQTLLETIGRLLVAFFEEQNKVVEPPPLLTGRDLIVELNLREGRVIGRLLASLKEAQAVGEVQTRAEALEFVKNDPDFARYAADQL